MSKRGMFIAIVLVIQVLCASFFLANILSSVIGFAPVNWQLFEVIELAAGLGLLIGVGLGVWILRQTIARNKYVEGQLRVASGAFMELMNDNFDTWELTPAERDVALFAIKGLSTAEIAALRDVSAGTIKAQTNAIYRKAGVTGRPQLLSLFIDDLIVLPAADAPKPLLSGEIKQVE